MTKDHEYLYPYSAQEAKKRNQLPMWRESYHANVACRNAIEETIRQNFDGIQPRNGSLQIFKPEVLSAASSMGHLTPSQPDSAVSNAFLLRYLVPGFSCDCPRF